MVTERGGGEERSGNPRSLGILAGGLELVQQSLHLGGQLIVREQVEEHGDAGAVLRGIRGGIAEGGQQEDVQGQLAGAGRQRGLFPGQVGVSRLGEQSGIHQAFLAGVGGAFSDDEQMQLLLDGSRHEFLRPPRKQSLLRLHDGVQRGIAAAVLPQLDDLGHQLAQFLDQAQQIVLFLWGHRWVGLQQVLENRSDGPNAGRAGDVQKVIGLVVPLSVFGGQIATAEQIAADATAVLCLKPVHQLPRERVGRLGVAAVCFLAPAMLEAQRENAAGDGSANLLLPAHARAQAAGEAECSILVERQPVAAGAKHGLRAVVTLEQLRNRIFTEGAHGRWWIGALPNPTLFQKGMTMAGMLGLGLGLVILFLLDRMNDQMNSYTELEEMFDEDVLGQIPRERAPGRKQSIPCLQVEDGRHSFVEAYRNLRSSLLYMTNVEPRPRTLLVTSSVPGDGKSLTAANLAITLAIGGSRVLLVDADLRRGNLMGRLNVEADKGFSEVFLQGMDWRQLVKDTSVPKLSLLPRGAPTQRSSEFFMGPVMDQFLKDSAAEYDYVVIDTAPVMAADDVTSLAPRVDGVLFVIRAEHTSSRVAHAAINMLYQRKATVLGLVFNSVHVSAGDYYYYYRYRDYYHKI